jgi:23S rRNA (cytosine1962-C5)-methyltransferase
VYAEGDLLPSLIVDRYGDCLVIQALSQATERLQPTFVRLLVDLVAPAGILARNDPRVRLLEGLERKTELLHGAVPERLSVKEVGIEYEVDLWHGQKTGLFLDQRENRLAARRWARGRVLDCFSYQGGFALALAAASDSVLALDISEEAVERISRNAERNGLKNVEARAVNVFDQLHEFDRAGERFDTIVLDPPAFAKNKPALPAAIRGYKDINLRAMRLLAAGGVLFTASCSFHLTKPLFLEMLQDAAADSGRRLALRAITGQPLDHPEVLTIPETGYLKGALIEALD